MADFYFLETQKKCPGYLYFPLLRSQHDGTPRIYALHKITIALKFLSYINLKLRPSYQTALNLCLIYINWKFREEVHEEKRSNWQLARITDRGIAS